MIQILDFVIEGLLDTARGEKKTEIKSLIIDEKLDEKKKRKPKEGKRREKCLNRTISQI